MASPPRIVLDADSGVTEDDIRALTLLGPVVRLDVMGLDVWAVTGDEELRALMADPAVLLSDEATTGLDVAAREQLLTTLDGLAATRPDLGTLTVTHHFEELPSTTTHALLLKAGRIVASGPVNDVLTSNRVSDAFDHPISVTRSQGRWAARAAAD